MLELCGMQSTPSLPSLPGLLKPGMVATDRVLSMGQIELDGVLMLNRIVWNRTVYMFKMDLALVTYNSWCTIKPNQTNMCVYIYYLKTFLQNTETNHNDIFIEFYFIWI